MKSVRFTILTLLISLVAMIAGCVSYQPPPSAIHADSYTALDDEQQRALPPTDKVLTRQEAITIALENNPDYKSKQLSMIKAYATYYGALSAFSPTLSAGYGIGRSKSGGGEYLNSTSGNLSAGYQAFSGLQTTMGALGALADAEASEWAAKDARRLLIKNVILTYNQILLDRAKVIIQQANVRYNMQNVENNELKYNAGASSLSDLLNFKIDANSAKNSVIQNTKSYKVDRYALAALMGLTTADLPDDTKFPEITVTDADEFELGVEFYLDIAIAERPDLKQYREYLKSSRYALYQSWGAFSPTLDLSTGWGFSKYGKDTPIGGSPYMKNNGALNYSASFSWNLWQGGSRIFAVRAAEATYDVAQQSLLSKWIAIVQEVRNEYVTLMADVASRKVLAQAKELSEQRRDLVQEEYNAGNKDVATLNQAQNNMVSAQQNYVTKTIEVANSRARLYAAVGVEQ